MSQVITATAYPDRVHLALGRKAYDISQCIFSIGGKAIPNSDYMEYNIQLDSQDNKMGKIKKKLTKLTKDMLWRLELAKI